MKEGLSGNRGSDKPMTDKISWSASAGRWMGIPVRIHVLLFLFVALIFAIQSNYPDRSVVSTAIVTSFCLLFCILVHELAHVFALTNLGGLVNNIVLTPWGGNSDFSLPEDTKGQLTVCLAGPFFNGCLFVLGATLLLQTDYSTLGELTNPFSPIAFDMNMWEVSLMKIVSWINFQLMLINLIPCFPFDGAGVMRAIVNRITTEASFVRREATLLVIGQATGWTMIGLGWILSDYHLSPIRPVWFLFLVVGISLLFAARYSYHQQMAMVDDLWDESDELECDSIYGDTPFFDLQDDDQSTYSQWLIEKQEERERMEREQEMREESKADEILKKLHREGIESLSEEEKGILNRVSARLRRRRQSEV